MKLVVEDIEQVPENLRDLYEEKDGEHRLKVEGVDFADEVKGALKKEREARKEAERKLSEANKAKEEANQKKLEEEQQWKELYEQQKTKTSELENKLVKGKLDSETEKIVSRLTQDENKARVLKKEVSSYLQADDDGTVKVVGLVNVGTTSELADHIKETMPFLVDGSRSTGGGATGNREGGTSHGGKVLTNEQHEALDPVQKMKFFRDGGRLKPE